MVCPTEDSPLNSDRQLEERLAVALKHRSYWALRGVIVTARGGLVTLAGQVPTFYARQVCQQACRQIAGVERIVDNVTVLDW